MKFKNEVWAVIPARSGSKGLKDKNIKIFKNKPLLAHSIISAKKNRFIKKIIFSSDSKRYISIAKKYGCDIYHKRSKKNSSSTSKDIDEHVNPVVSVEIAIEANAPKFALSGSLRTT